MTFYINETGGRQIVYQADQFDGYDAFELANQQWGDTWQQFEVTDGLQVLERVLNPNYLEIQDR